MTDITALAQRMRAAAEKAKHAGEAPVMNFCARIDALNEFQLAACPANVLALVEALESRSVTVKQLLPRRKTADDYIDDTFDPSDLAAAHNACRLECEVKLKNALDAAGIQVIEGEQK